jgi:hypothetical protein
MKKLSLLILILFICWGSIIAQLNQRGGIPLGLMDKSLNSAIITTQLIPNQTPEELLLEDALYDGKDGFPLRVGVSIPVSISIIEDGTPITLDNNIALWQYKLNVSNAKGLCLIFKNLVIPDNSKLYIYTADGESILGYFDSESNSPDKPFVTQFIHGDEIIIEYQQRLDELADYKNISLNIIEVAYAYKAINESIDIPKSDPCQVNINCPEGDNWRKQQRGVAKIVFREGSSWYLCSGSLINNTAQDGTRYFLTAEHCGGDASEADRNVWQFYFRYERPDCTNTWGPINSTAITGCSLVAKGLLAGGSDFQLLELNNAVPRSLQPYFNGWDRSTWASTSGVGIHHPSGDVKKISSYSSALQTASPNIGGSLMATGSAWRTVWVATTTNHGVTEPGSSGSALFNNNKRIVGTLSGGSSSCSTPSYPDYYGKLTYHWESNGTLNTQQLKPWLDPLGLNPTQLDGFDPLTPQELDIEVNSVQAVLTWTPPFITSGLSGYKVYENETLISTLASSASSHTINYTTPGDFEYYVTATFTNPSYESDPSNIVIAEIDGFNVTFEITNTSGTPITDATVTFNSVTAEPGVYIFAVLNNGDYEYSISKDGFNAQSGTLTVNGADITQPVILSLVSTPSIAQQLVKVYPNPFDSKIHVENAQSVAEINVSSIIGQRILSFPTAGNEITLDTDAIQPGLYIITLKMKNGENAVFKLIKN